CPGKAHHCRGGACPALYAKSTGFTDWRPPHEARRNLSFGSSHLRQSHSGKTHRPQRRRKTRGRLRQHSPQPRRLLLSLERQSGKSTRVFASNQTTERKLGGLEREVKRLHSYEVPEFIALP